jgi:EAL domain-containing protein (putative c-di-GMP-specific phosphodiesterase class I)
MISLGIPRFASLFAPDQMHSDAFSPEEKKTIRALTVSTKNLNAALNEGHVISASRLLSHILRWTPKTGQYL